MSMKKITVYVESEYDVIRETTTHMVYNKEDGCWETIAGDKVTIWGVSWGKDLIIEDVNNENS